MQKLKTVQYFFDARTYSKNQIIENLQTQREQDFFNKTAKINISLNEFGVYVATLTFMPKEKHFLKVTKTSKKEKVLKNENKNDSKKSRYEKLISTERKYGQYKETKTYKPY